MNLKQISEQAIIDYFEKHDLYIDFHPPGIDNEKPVAISDWNKVHQAMITYLENFYELDWEDESTYCEVCYKHIHTSPGYYGDPGNFIWTEYGTVCETCVLENPEDYLEIFSIWSDTEQVKYKAVPSWLICKLEENGYVPFHSINTACKDVFEAGFHVGQTDTPEGVAKLVTDELGPVEMIFAIDSAGQFDVHFSAYVKLEEK